MRRTLPILVAIAVVLSFGVAQGLWSHRWIASRDLEDAVARLGRVPAEASEWEGQDEVFDPRQLEQAEISGHVLRRYQNRQDGSVVSILLVCGRTGPIAVHPPDVCYQAAGNELVGEPTREVVRRDGGLPPAEFMKADFLNRGSVIPRRLRIYWSWSDGGPWKAPGDPRLTFAGSPALYKVYVIHETVGAAGPAADPDPCLGFIRAFLPALGTSLAPPR
jgi:hypothetical protein